ncbi:MAG: ferrous iron transporter B [Bacillota bacterium]|nr:ferrous iron transporter B [Bacillota bacterium]
MRILLMGNPNVGKSVVFSRLTGTQVITSNYPGTTVEFTKGVTRLRGGEKAEVIDAPGTYSLEPTCKAEEVAVSLLDGLQDGDVVVNVVDATHLERNLHLTLELLERGVPLVVALNLWDEARHEGISIDVRKLEDLLGVPVVPTVALTGAGIDVLLDRVAAEAGCCEGAGLRDTAWNPAESGAGAGARARAGAGTGAETGAETRAGAEPRAGAEAGAEARAGAGARAEAGTEAGVVGGATHVPRRYASVVESPGRLPPPTTPARTPDERWADVGRITREVQAITHRHHSVRDILEDASMRPVTGLLMAAAVLSLSFAVIRFIGEGLIAYVFDPAFESLARPLVMKLDAALGPAGFIHDMLIGHLVGGQVDFVESLGLLTTGLYVPIAMVLPYVLAFYLVLSILEDVGYLPRLAVLLDNLMHALGMHGYAVVPMVLGLGCNVPAVLATRVLESRREKFIAAAMLSIGVPCMAQSAMIVGLVGRHGGSYLAYIYGTLFVLWLTLGLVLNSVLPGQSPPLLIEIPPYRLPYFVGLVRKVWMRVRIFLADAVPYVLLGVLIVNLLHASGLMDVASRLLAPVLSGLLGLPPDAAVALLMGFLRKDVAVGMLGPLGLNARQLAVASVVLTAYFPCAATFVVLLRELGTADMVKAAGTMVVAAFGAGAALNLVLSGTVSAALVLAAVATLVAAAYLVRRRAGAGLGPGPGVEGSGDGATAHDTGA